MRYAHSSRFLLLSILLLPTQAFSQSCAPKDFTISDLEKIDFSEVAKYSGYSVLDTSSASSSDKKINGSTIVNGAPVQLSYADAKSASEHMLNKSGYNSSRDTKLAYVRSALSSVGAEMYSNCLSAQSIKVDIPSTAFSEQSFFANITWKPQYASPKEADVKIRLIGGTIDGATDVVYKIESYQDIIVKIDRENNKVQLSVSIDGKTHPTVFIPPIAQLKSFKIVKRNGSGSGADRDGDRCTNHAYLVDEVGSNIGAGAKICDLCVDSTTNGILLPSTAQISPLPEPRGTQVRLSENNNQLRACGLFRTNGAGRGSGRFEVRHGTFVVWELVSN